LFLPFLSERVAREWNETTGDKSITKIVKRAIVEALISANTSE
jgi:hypothetical protein